MDHPEVDPALPAVVALADNLFFVAPLTNAIRAAGARPEFVDNPASLAEAIDDWPALVLIDLAMPAAWHPVIQRAKALPQTRSIPVVAFGSHQDTAALAAARAAGCDHVWARSHFVNRLPSLLDVTLNPPSREIPGCDAEPPPGLRHAIDQFNSGEYWHCHETLEALWIAEPGEVRALYQGILQIGVAFHHLTARNYAGAVKMLRRGLPRLRGFPAHCQGVPVAGLVTAARSIHDRLVALGPVGIDQFDLATLPRINLGGKTAV